MTRSDETVLYATAPSSLGIILVAQQAGKIVLITLGDDATSQVEDLRARFPRSTLIEDVTANQEILYVLVKHVDNPTEKLSLPLPLNPSGTDFQLAIWHEISQIPLGKTASYSELAKSVNNPGGVRAVAQACGSNPLAIVVPCHRVLKSDGSLGGYRWGVERKRKLLERERKVKGREFFNPPRRASGSAAEAEEVKEEDGIEEIENTAAPAGTLEPEPLPLDFNSSSKPTTGSAGSQGSSSCLAPLVNDRPTSSIFARKEDAPIHNVPMAVIRRPLPSELDEGKVLTFMEEMKVSSGCSLYVNCVAHDSG